LLAAVASYLRARSKDGRWLVRVEDIDLPRELPGATELILATLQAYGFEWDGPVTYQSQGRGAHDAAVEWLLRKKLAYRCGCSRRDLADARRGPLGIIYPGYCRSGCLADSFAVRVRTNDEPINFYDGLQGNHAQYLLSQSGDFVILRRDSLIAYHLAVAVDDNLQGITEVVRGIDLLDSTPRQIWLQRLLGYTTPAYVHIPVATNARGQKLSKSHGAGGISQEYVSETLAAALAALGQNPPQELARASLKVIWDWALENWKLDVLTGQSTIPVAHIPFANAEIDIA
jgi:glutamyl-Q tRNA(Asp) synthetase